jgi:hypothetical protein
MPKKSRRERKTKRRMSKKKTQRAGGCGCSKNMWNNGGNKNPIMNGGYGAPSFDTLSLRYFYPYNNHGAVDVSAPESYVSSRNLSWGATGGKRRRTMRRLKKMRGGLPDFTSTLSKSVINDTNTSNGATFVGNTALGAGTQLNSSVWVQPVGMPIQNNMV